MINGGERKKTARVALIDKQITYKYQFGKKSFLSLLRKYREVSKKLEKIDFGLMANLSDPRKIKRIF